MKEVWVLGCGQCGRDIVLKADLSVDLRIPAEPWAPITETPCAGCLKAQETGDMELGGDRNLIEEAVSTLMGWCGCGSPEDVTELVMRFLELSVHWDVEGAQETRDKREALCGGHAQLYLVAYVADALGWTEHGGSVGGEWLTDTGEAALARWTLHNIEAVRSE